MLASLTRADRPLARRPFPQTMVATPSGETFVRDRICLSCLCSLARGKRKNPPLRRARTGRGMDLDPEWIWRLGLAELRRCGRHHPAGYRGLPHRNCLSAKCGVQSLRRSRIFPQHHRVHAALCPSHGIVCARVAKSACKVGGEGRRFTIDRCRSIGARRV